MPTTAATITNSEYLKEKFDAGLPYDEYATTGEPHQTEAWAGIYKQASLTPKQKTLIESFNREMHIIVSSGVWCGDCVQQIPLLARIAEANPKIKLRIVDRDQHTDLAEQITVNAGMRVPVALFLSEDFELVSIFGDRTLTRYRAIAARQLGAACALPGAPVPDDELAGTLQEWLNEVERAHLVLRTSARLREKHGD